MSQSWDVTLIGDTPSTHIRGKPVGDAARLSMVIRLADGRLIRWGDNEDDTAKIPQDLGFTTKVPGGFDQLNTGLLRSRRQREDEQLFSEVAVVGAGGLVAWEGLMSALPRAGLQVQPQAVGYSSLLMNDPSFMENYVDADVTHWGAATPEEEIRLATSGLDTSKFSFAAEFGNLIVRLPPGSALGASVHSSAWYLSPPGCKVGKVRYNGTRTTWPSGWRASRVHLYDNPDGSVAAVDDMTTTLDGSARVATATTPARYARISAASEGNNSTPAVGTEERYTELAVYGNHGLTVQSDGTILGHDLVDDVVRRCAPGLKRKLEYNGFGVPHLRFDSPVTAADAISVINAYYAWEWAVWENQTFEWREPRARTLWIARRDENADGSLEGDQAESVINGVVVYYTDYLSGRQRVVGPPGCANADVTNTLLQDVSPNNPINRAGLGRKWERLDLSYVTTDAGAAQIGAVWLQQRNLATRRGDISISGMAQRADGVVLPAWMVRAGDYVAFSDQPNEPQRRIISTRYQHSTRTVAASVDNSAQKIEAILERLAVLQVSKV